MSFRLLIVKTVITLVFVRESNYEKSKEKPNNKVKFELEVKWGACMWKSLREIVHTFLAEEKAEPKSLNQEGFANNWKARAIGSLCDKDSSRKL